MHKRITPVLLLLIFIISCNQNPYKATNKNYRKQAKVYAKTLGEQPQPFTTVVGDPPYWVGTTNFNMRKPNYVIIHHTAQRSCGETLNTFTLPRTQVSAHYVICKDGIIYHMLNDYLRAWHGGVAKWGNNTDINSSSIGIEIDNDGFEGFTEPQINSLLQLLDTLKHKYGIPTANFIGHADIAPTRKNDPNVTFPWKRLAEKGFGLWYDQTTDSIPTYFNSIQALKIIGYDVRDTTAVITTFKRKFLQQDSSRVLTSDDKKVLYSLMKKSM